MIPKTIDAYYRLHAPFYDSTRWAFLFGRNSLRHLLPSLPKNPTILDLGCGTGKHLSELKKEYPESIVYAIDRSRDMLSQVDQNQSSGIKFVVGEYEARTFVEAQFDLILCSYSLSMMDNLESKLENIRLHLKPNAHVLVVDFDTTPFTWFAKWMQKNHVYFDHLLFRKLSEYFIVERSISKSAYLGLYRYSSFVGRNR